MKKTLFSLACLLALDLCAELPGQVLARPGWAGSGVAPESWWRHAVFYRLDPARFQASAGGGTGDLAGIAQRLDYLQSLGVDALVLDAGPTPDLSQLGDLIREASRYHLRLLLTAAPPQPQDGQRWLQTIHGWLSAGAAGVWLPRVSGQEASAQAGYANLVSELNGLLRGFPGERVLLADPVPGSAGGAATSAFGNRHPALGLRAAAAGQLTTGQLTTIATLPVQPLSATALRASLEVIGGASGVGVPGLIRFAGDPATGSPDAVGLAAVLLGSPATAMFNFGDEIGLQTSAPLQGATDDVLPVMQWTPLNVQQGTAAPIERAAPAGAGQGETAYGAYRPYIHPPPPTLTGAAPASPRVGVDGDIPASLPAPNSLPGFTTGTLPNQPVDGEKINVVFEDRDPDSLLNAYRRLIALHHGNAALRNGTEIVLNRDADQAVVWVRRAPASSRTASSVLVAVNLGDRPVTLSLDSDLAHAGLPLGALRSLFQWAKGQAAAATMAGETTGALRLPPHAVFVGEMLHAGPGASSRRTRR